MTRTRPRRPAGRHPSTHGWHGHVMAGGAARVRRRAQRRDRREGRPIRRRHVLAGVAAGLILLPGSVVLGILVVVALAVWAVVEVVDDAWPVLLALAAVGLAYRVARPMMRRRRERAAEEATQVPAPGSGLPAWQRAKADFDRLRLEYSAHECDPMQVLRRPALSDVSVPSTARFIDAFAEAQSLDTGTSPGAPYDAVYAVAVAKARRAWQAALDAADRIRLSNVPAAERGSIERTLKLLTTARDSDSEHERLAAYARARTELDRLDRAGIVHLPRTARAAVDEAARGALPS